MRHFVVLFLLCLPCIAIAQSNTQFKKDSLRKVITDSEGKEKLSAYGRLTNIYFVEVGGDPLKLDTLLNMYKAMIAEAKRQDNKTSLGIAMCNTLSALSNVKKYDEVIKLTPEYIDYLAKHEVWKYYYIAYGSMIQAYRAKGEMEKAVEAAQQLYEQAKKQGHNDGIGNALSALAELYGAQRRFDEEEKYLRQCIGIFESDEALAALTANTYFKLCGTLIVQRRFDEALQELAKFEKFNRHYDEITKVTQTVSWINLWDQYATLYLRTGEYDKAESYCDKIDNAHPNLNTQISVCKIRAQIDEAQEQYEKALEALDRAEGLGGKSNSIRGLRISVLSNMGRAKEAYALFQIATAYNDSMRNVQFNRQIDELRTVYETDKIAAEKERMRKALIYSIGGCVVLFVLGGVIFYLYRKKRAAHRALTERIRQWAQMAVEQMPLLMSGEDVSEPEDAEYTLVEEPRPERGTPKATDTVDGTLLEKMQQLFVVDKIYRDPDISLDIVAQKLDVNRSYLSNTVNRLTGKNFSSYVSEYRVKEAVRVMASPTANNYSIEGIAFESGFNNRKTFYEAFRKITGLSPGEFRKNIQRS